MENISVKAATRAASLNRQEAGHGLKDIPGEQQGFNSLSHRLTAEGGKNIFLYLKSFNLLSKQDFLILSPTSHYYYEENDFRNIKTIVNLIKLNTISNPDTFFTTLIRVLPADVNFIGCFSITKPFMGAQFLSDLTARVNNLLDLGPERMMDRKDVAGLLGKYGFRVIDMTEMNGLIYFYSRRDGQHLKIRA
ncbi:MAG: hypothetical protein MUE74_09650 [Bacteroidales bacterium]|nr:hypothetical protein [Bacteroidales bacterium]